MKIKWLHLMLLTILVSPLGLSSCNNEDDDTDASNNSRELLENKLENGNWSITKFIDSEKNETDHFMGYTFEFMSSGVLQASNGTNNYQGSWSVRSSNGNDDSMDDMDLMLNFNLSNDFEDLNEDWDILSQSAVKIELIHISGGNGGTDYLTFEK